MLDIFNDDAFSVVPLTTAINLLKFQPGRLGELGIFSEAGVNTTSIAIERQDDILVLVPPTPRGGPGITVDKTKRTLRNINIPHFEINDAIMAEEVQGVRAFGEESALETVMGKVSDRQMKHVGSHTVTEEYSRVGAIKGEVTYSDGTTLNLFDEFDVTKPAIIDWNLDASASTGAVRKQCAAVFRLMAAALGGVPFSGIYAFCGDTFFDDLIANAEVRATYLQQEEARALREGYIRPNGKSYGTPFDFGGIIWENYRGQVGATKYIADDACHLFPVGVPGLFETKWAPADYLETVNTTGRRFYNKQYAMPNDKGVHFDVQTNAIHICTRPNVLFEGART